MLLSRKCTSNRKRKFWRGGGVHDYGILRAWGDNAFWNFGRQGGLKHGSRPWSCMDIFWNWPIWTKKGQLRLWYCIFLITKLCTVSLEKTWSMFPEQLLLKRSIWIYWCSVFPFPIMCYLKWVQNWTLKICSCFCLISRVHSLVLIQNKSLNFMPI